MNDHPSFEIDEAPKTSLTLLYRASCNIQSAWVQLFRQYHPSIFARCHKTWELNRDDSENAVQDVFSAISRKLAEFRRARKGSFRKWIRIITDNKCKDTIKQTPVAVGVGGDEIHRAIENIADPINDDATEPEFQRPKGKHKQKTYLIKNAQKTVRQNRKPRDWEIFNAVIMDNRDRTEVATEMGVTLNVVNLVVSRVRRELREEFQRQINISQNWQSYLDSE